MSIRFEANQETRVSENMKTKFIKLYKNFKIKLTFPRMWMACSIKIEITTNTKHTTATAHVGVSSNERARGGSAFDIVASFCYYNFFKKKKFYSFFFL